MAPLVLLVLFNLSLSYHGVCFMQVVLKKIVLFSMLLLLAMVVVIDISFGKPAQFRDFFNRLF